MDEEESFHIATQVKKNVLIDHEEEDRIMQMSLYQQNEVKVDLPRGMKPLQKNKFLVPKKAKENFGDSSKVKFIKSRAQKSPNQVKRYGEQIP